MKSLFDSEIESFKWNSILLNNPLATSFQSSEFCVFYNSVPNSYAKVFSIEDNGRLKSLCVVTIQKESGLKGYFSRRAIIYGGPLLTEEGDEAFTQLLKLMYKELKGKVIYIETRNFNDYSQYKSIFANDGWSYLPYMNVQLSLQNKNWEDILSAMNYNRRREIRLSLNEGAIYEEASTINEVRSLYLILSELYRVRVKLPLPSLEYFEKLFLSPIGKVFIVKHFNQVIGGAFCFYYEGKSINTLYYCGIRDYNKKIFPTHLAIVAAIKFGIKNKLTMLDFMGAGKAGEEYGVRNYKVEFGGDLVEHGRFIKIYNPFLFHVGQLGLGLLKKIKR